MQGRRVSRRQRRNPLYVIFMGLLAVAVVLVITVIVLGAKLSSANRELAEVQTKLEQLQNGGAQQGEDVLGADDTLSGDAQDDIGTADDPQGDAPEVGSDTQSGQSDANSGQQSTSGADMIDWLDLTGHSEVSVKPKSVYDKYYVYYTSDGVNLRSGPGTSYDKVKLLDLGTEVKAAAKQDGWTFVSVDDKFGWINSDYLSTTRPEPKVAETTATTDSSASSASQTGSTGAGTADNSGADTGAASGSTDTGDTEIPDWLKVG